MDIYLQKLCAYIQANKITFEQDDPQPCLDALWWHYGEYHKVDTPFSMEHFRSLRTQLETLPIQDSDRLFSEVACLCAEHERVAFAAGLRLGVQLMLEIGYPSVG